MTLWFFVIGLLGIWGIARHPAVFAAVNPVYGLPYLFANGYASFLVLGGVFLCVTGAEALYADMGHFGAAPDPVGVVHRRLSEPDPELRRSVGYRARRRAGLRQYFLPPLPGFLLIPLVMLATVATVIASQSIITGAFSMTRQAIQLGWLPRLRIIQTSERGYGQIYVGIVNWLLDGRDRRPDPIVSEVGQSRRRLWHSGLGDHAHDLGAAVHRHARNLGLERRGCRFGRRCFLLR